MPRGRGQAQATLFENRLFYGDNLRILRNPAYVRGESVDLIYLDPPFGSGRNYNLLFRAHSGAHSESQVRAFEDTWHWGAAAAEAYHDIKENAPPQVARTLEAMRTVLNESDMFAYLCMMLPRLVELRRVLRATGSIYLHCDPVASHYLKVLMDAVFGPTFFKNEIIWKRTSSKSLQTRRLPSNHDVLLLYGDPNSKWNQDSLFEPYDDAYVRSKYPHSDPDGRRYGLWDLTNPNRDRPHLTYEFLGVTKVWRWTQDRMQEAYEAGRVVQPRPGAVPRFKRYLDEQRGVPLGDVWTDISPINSQARERLGYPTQKPIELLRRVIEASSEPGDVVLDPFCGCGTTLDAAQELGRQWIGIDIAYEAINIIRGRLGPDAEYRFCRST